MGENEKLRQAIENLIGLSEQSTENTQDNSQTKNDKATDPPATVSRIAETIEASEHCSASDSEGQPAKDPYELGIVVFTAILACTAIITNLQTCKALRENRAGFQAAQRAYVAFGSKSGELAELTNQRVGNKPVIVLHFINAGQTTARHFTVHAYSNAQSQGPAFTHMHRFRFDNTGAIERQGALGETDLAGQTEYREFISDPKWLKTEAELAGPNSTFVVQGEFEYCDIFGNYHCQQFSAEYSHALGQFKPWLSANLPCLIERPDPNVFGRAWFQGQWIELHEIEPCEQPDEPEYHRRVDVAAKITAHAGFQADATIQTPRPTATQ